MLFGPAIIIGAGSICASTRRDGSLIVSIIIFASRIVSLFGVSPYGRHHAGAVLHDVHVADRLLRRRKSNFRGRANSEALSFRDTPETNVDLVAYGELTAATNALSRNVANVFSYVHLAA